MEDEREAVVYREYVGALVLQAIVLMNRAKFQRATFNSLCGTICLFLLFL